MKESEQAIPTFFRTAIKESTKIIKSKPKKQDEDALVQMAESAGWDKTKEILDSKLSSLEDAYAKSFQTAIQLEEIGVRALIKEMVKMAYDSVIETVELPLKARDATDTK